MATVTTHRDVYIDVRRYLIKTLGCDPAQVIQSHQNGSPLPKDAVVMSVLYERELHTTTNTYYESEQKSVVQQSREITMQLDFYGSQAQARSQKIAVLWKNYYTAAELTKCQPLYAKDPRRLPVVNEQAVYEDRWSLDVLIQYNPEVEHTQDFLGMPTVTFNKI